jgi:ribosomal-protein-alanine N-acetyltransferase
MMTSSHLQLQTQHLTVVPFTLEFIEVLARRDEAEELVGAAIPHDWPDEELAGLIGLYADWLREDPSVIGYGPWVVIARAESIVVASAGFVGKPDADGKIELGFGTHTDYRNRGYASEAARALVDWGLAQPSVERVIAKCDPDNYPSVRVLEKIGMQRVGDTDGQLLWQADVGPAMTH